MGHENEIRTFRNGRTPDLPGKRHRPLAPGPPARALKTNGPVMNRCRWRRIIVLRKYGDIRFRIGVGHRSNKESRKRLDTALGRFDVGHPDMDDIRPFSHSLHCSGGLRPSHFSSHKYRADIKPHGKNIYSRTILSNASIKPRVAAAKL